VQLVLLSGVPPYPFREENISSIISIGASVVMISSMNHSSVTVRAVVVSAQLTRGELVSHRLEDSKNPNNPFANLLLPLAVYSLTASLIILDPTLTIENVSLLLNLSSIDVTIETILTVADREIVLFGSSLPFPAVSLVVMEATSVFFG
jgi:hypothetical protein